MCTGFEILPTIFGGGAAAGAGAGALGLGAGIEALSVGSALGGVTGGVLTGGGAALGGLGAAGLGAGALGAAELLGGGAALAEGAGVGSVLGGLAGGGGAEAGLGFGFGADFGLGAAGAGEAGLGAGALDWGFAPAAEWGASALASPLTSLASFAKTAQPYMSVASGVKGLIDAEEMKRMARRAAMQADPWGTSGGRSVADAQLQELLRDPSAVAATDPAFKLRIQGAQRANAQYGQDSGAMSIAGANASTDWYNARLAQLAGLAGGTVAPGAGGGLMVQGLDNAFDASSAALASLGYAAGTAGAGNGGLTPAQRAQLAKLAIGG
jgi:hypothetical protein